jgi:Mce-associated membrane protein
MAVHAHSTELAPVDPTPALHGGADNSSVGESAELLAAEAEPIPLRADDTAAYGDAVHSDLDGVVTAPPAPEQGRSWRSPVRLGICAGLGFAAVLSGLVGWLSVGVHEAQHSEQQREQFVQVGRQAAVNLTTIDWQHVDRDVQRILESATGTFFDDFSKRSQPFVDVVKQAHSISVGTVAVAGLESVTGDAGQVLVAVSVKTSNAGAAEQEPRAWRMRMSVQKVGEQVKVSNVEFVP